MKIYQLVFSIIFLVLILFLIINLNLYAQSLAYTLISTSKPEGFNFRYPTTYGLYNFKVTNDSRGYSNIYFYSTNTHYSRGNYRNYFGFNIKSFDTRTLLYSYLQNNPDKHIVIDIFPFSQGRPTVGTTTYYFDHPGIIYFYSRPSINNAEYAYLYGDISDLIAFYNCEDYNWRIRSTCLGTYDNYFQRYNPSDCFGNPYMGEIIFDGLIANDNDFRASGLTICVRKLYSLPR
jgi:hypothetical protein